MGEQTSTPEREGHKHDHGGHPGQGKPEERSAHTYHAVPQCDISVGFRNGCGDTTFNYCFQIQPGHCHCPDTARREEGEPAAYYKPPPRIIRVWTERLFKDFGLNIDVKDDREKLVGFIELAKEFLKREYA